MTQTFISPKLLYDQDFLQWKKLTIADLHKGDFNQLDIANLIEEIEPLGKAQKMPLKDRFGH